MQKQKNSYKNYRRQNTLSSLKSARVQKRCSRKKRSLKDITEFHYSEIGRTVLPFWAIHITVFELKYKKNNATNNPKEQDVFTFYN